MITGWWAAGLAAFAGVTHAVMAAGFLGRQRWAWALGAGSYAVLAALGLSFGPLWLMGFGVAAGAFGAGWFLHPEAVARQRHRDNPVLVGMDGSNKMVMMSNDTLSRITEAAPPTVFRPEAGPPPWAYSVYRMGSIPLNRPSDILKGSMEP